MHLLPRHPLFKRLRRWVRRDKFLCPHCLRWNDYRLACGGCWLEAKTGPTDPDGPCPRCRARLDADAVRALCRGCGGAALHGAYHQRPARVLAALREEDFASLLASTGAGSDAAARNALGYAYDNGASLACVLNLSAFTEKVVERAEAFWEIEAVWVDAAENGSPQALAGSLKEATNLLIRRAGLTAGQRRRMRLCVRQPALAPAVAHDLEIRFGSLTYGVEAAGLLRGEGEEATAAAAELIGRVGQAADITAMMVALKTGAREAREAAVVRLVSVGGPAAPALIDALKDNYWFVRKNAAQTLGVIADSSSAPALIEHATCQHPLERGLTASAAPALVEALGDADRDVRESAAEALGKIGPAALPLLVESLKDTDRAMPAWAAVALKKMGGQAVGALVAASRDWDVPARENVAEVLGLIGDAQAVGALVEMIRHGGGGPERESVMKALKRGGDGRALVALKEADAKFHSGSGCGLCRAASELKVHEARASWLDSRRARR